MKILLLDGGIVQSKINRQEFFDAVWSFRHHSKRVSIDGIFLGRPVCVPLEKVDIEKTQEAIEKNEKDLHRL